jgi:hypothetical protein
VPASNAEAARGPIEGLRCVPLRRIPDERGAIYHMLKRRQVFDVYRFLGLPKPTEAVPQKSDDLARSA